MEPVAVATPWLDLENVVYELAWPGRRKLDAHHCRSLLPTGACIKDCLQWGWLLLAVFGNVAGLVAYKALSILDLYLWLPAL